jgi:hypothetical protein
MPAAGRTSKASNTNKKVKVEAATNVPPTKSTAKTPQSPASTQAASKAKGKTLTNADVSDASDCE